MMAGMSSDLEVLKDIPGYKAILKTVLKSQIQLLIEQLSDHTGEETIVLTASVHDGTLSHLGSITGKGFLDGRDEIKSQFLAFCLKSHHRRKSSEARSSPYQRPQSGGQGDRLTPSQGHIHKRARLQPVSLQRAGNSENTGNSFTPPDIHRAPSQSFNGQDNSSSINVKLESSEQSVSCADNTDYAASSVSFPSSLQLSHTQTSVDQATSDNSEIHNDEDLTEQTSENDDSAATSIKIEPITENEMELEITGVEPGKSSVSSDSWGQGQLPGSSGVGEGVPTEAGDQSGYIQYPHNVPRQMRSPRGEGLTMFPCPYCNKVFGQNVILVRHIRRHTGEKPFQCSICQVSFARKSSLMSHRISKHAGECLPSDDVLLPNTYT